MTLLNARTLGELQLDIDTVEAGIGQAWHLRSPSLDLILSPGSVAPACLSKAFSGTSGGQVAPYISLGGGIIGSHDVVKFLDRGLPYGG